MAARTASVTGLWSSTSTWGGAAVPVSGDSVTINNGVTVTMDVDQSGFASGLISMVVTGTLTFSAITNSYLKMAGAITGAGTINIGSSGTPHPSAYTATILMNGNFSINGPLINAYCNPAGGMAVPGDETYVTGQEEKVGWMTIIPQPSTSGASMPILSISNGNPCTVVCSAAHGFAANAVVTLLKLGGMFELDHCRCSVLAVSTTNVANDTVTLKWTDSGRNINSTNFGTYSGGAGILCANTAVAAGATTVYVDQDMSADPEWLRGIATVGGLHFNNISRTVECTRNTNISGPLVLNSAGGVYSITATGADKVVGTAGVAKLSGSKVVLTTRNVTIRGTTNTTQLIQSRNSHTLNCTLTANAGFLCLGPSSVVVSRGFHGGMSAGVTSCIGYGTGHVINGGNFSGSGRAFYASSGHIINGGIVSGCTYFFDNTTSSVINNITAAGTSSLSFSNTTAFTINNGKFMGMNNIFEGGESLAVVNGGHFVNNAYMGAYSPARFRIAGGTFVGSPNGLLRVNSVEISGGKFHGYSVLFTNDNNQMFNNTISGGEFDGISTLASTANGLLVSGGTFNNIGTLFSSGNTPQRYVLAGGTFTSITTTFAGGSFGDIYGDASITPVIVGSNQPITGYGANFILANLSGYFSTTPRNQYSYIICYDNAGIKGDIVAGMQGGTIVPDTTTIPASPPVTLTTANKFTFTGYSTWDSPCFYDTKIFAKAMQSVKVIVYMKKSLNSMLSTPQVQIIDPNKSPLSAGSILASSTMTDNTNWQTITTTYTSPSDRMLAVRIIGKHTSGNLWCSVPAISIGSVITIEE